MFSIWRKSRNGSVNDGYSVCKGLRKLGVDSDLFIERPSHVASLPQWEDGEVDMDILGDPYDPNWTPFTGPSQTGSEFGTIGNFGFHTPELSDGRPSCSCCETTI